MKYVCYHQPTPHMVRVRTTEYVFKVVIGVSIAKMPMEDAELLLRTTEQCCGGNTIYPYRVASPAQIRLWNGAARPEHFDTRYEPHPSEIDEPEVLEMRELPYPRLSVIVPVWNRVQTTWSFLQNFIQFGNLRNAQLIIVDNGSTDATPKAAERWRLTHPDRIRVVRHEANMGVSRGYNAGVEAAEASFLLFLNNDVAISGDIVKPVVSALLADDQAIYGTRIIRHNGYWNAVGDTIIPYVEGWFVGCTKEVFADIGGFDERYSPCDFEDVDFSYAAVQKGYELRNVGAPCKHQHLGVTADQLQDRRAITEQHRLRFIEKWELS